MPHSIVVKDLSKQFRIGAAQQDSMLRERIVRLLRSPVRRRQNEADSLIWALKGVSFSIEPGEVVGIIGRNGAGKSTLLKILSRITHATSGTIAVTGRVAALLEVGTGFHDELTGRENIYLNGSILGMKKREVEEKMDAIIDFSGVDQFIDTPIKRYSSGMRLRLGFAVAAHLDPDILIIDEVLAVGDAGFQKKCLNVMGDLRRAGRTVLFVSHNMAAVENLCSRGIWIDAGRVRQDGPAREVIQNYMGAFASEDTVNRTLTNEGRGGVGDIRYTKVEFLDRDGKPKGVIQSGDSVVLRFLYHAVKPVRHPSFGFQMFTDLGTLITNTATWHHSIEIPVVPVGDGFIDLEIDFLNLLPGRYHMSLWISAGADHVVQDAAEHSVYLDVELANVYKSNRVIDGRYGLVYFPQRWDLRGLGVESHVQPLVASR
jgi:lipopolysaccharide transport system ATP-binding protein